MHDCLSISQWLLSTTRVLGVVLEFEVISGRLFLNEYIHMYIASFPDFLAHLQTLKYIIRTIIFYPPKSGIRTCVSD